MKKLILLLLISIVCYSQQRTSNWSLGALGKAVGLNANTTSNTHLSECDVYTPDSPTQLLISMGQFKGSGVGIQYISGGTTWSGFHYVYTAFNQYAGFSVYYTTEYARTENINHRQANTSYRSVNDGWIIYETSVNGSWYVYFPDPDAPSLVFYNNEWVDWTDAYNYTGIFSKHIPIYKDY